LLGVWFAGALSRGCVLSALADASSDGRCEAGGCCEVEIAGSLPVLAAVLLSSSAPKLSEGDGWSYRAGRCGWPWKDTFVDASGVTLYTGRPLAVKLDLRAARTGPSRVSENINKFQCLRGAPGK
jgi:hypothetical protein